MTDKPIIFSGPMVRAILDGRKTQTRRIIKPQLGDIASAFQFVPGKWRFLDHSGARVHQVFSPPFSNGDRLWVREQHYLTDDGEAECVIHTADDDAVAQHHSDIARLQAQYGFSDEWAKTHLRIRPSIHMPRWASRLTLIVEDVRVQRLQDITEADAISEGIPAAANSQTIDCDTPRPSDGFRSLWNSIHGPESWDANPWVAAYTFRAIRANIDSPEASA